MAAAAAFRRIRGEYFALAALVIFASNIILTKTASAKLDLNAGFLVVVSVNVAFAALLLCIELALRKDALHWDWLGFLLFVVAGFFSTYFCRWFLLESIARLGPAKTSAFQVTSPLFTVIIAWAFLGERLSAIAILAMALTMFGLLLVGTRPGSLRVGARHPAAPRRPRSVKAIAGRARAVGPLAEFGSSAARSRFRPRCA